MLPLRAVYIVDLYDTNDCSNFHCVTLVAEESLRKGRASAVYVSSESVMATMA